MCTAAAFTAFVAAIVLFKWAIDGYSADIMRVIKTREVENGVEITLSDGANEYTVNTKKLFAESEYVIVWSLELDSGKKLKRIQENGRTFFSYERLLPQKDDSTGVE